MEIRALFNSGISFEELLKNTDEDNRNKTVEILNNLDFDKSLIHRINSLEDKLNILVIAELWCPDCIVNLPVIRRMEELNPNIKISIVNREENMDFFGKYSVEGKVKIPTFVFYDKDFNELGSFIEKPFLVKDVYSKNDQVEIVVTTRDYRKGKFVGQALKEILDIVQDGGLKKNN